MSLRKPLLIGLIFFPVMAAALAPAHIGFGVPEGESLKQELKGVWCASDDGGKTCWGFDHFVDDRVIEACGRFPETGQAFHAKGEYEVRGRTICIVVTESDDPKAFPLGSRFCAEVLHISRVQQRHRFTDTGVEDTTYRRPLSAMQCPSGSATTPNPSINPDAAR